MHHAWLVLDRILRAGGVASPVVPLQATAVVPVALDEIITVHVDVDLQRTVPLVVDWSLDRHVVVCPRIFLLSCVFDPRGTAAQLRVLIPFVPLAFVVVLIISQLMMGSQSRAPVFLEFPVSVVCR